MLMLYHPSCILPVKGRSEPSPLTGEGWIGVIVDRDPFSFSVGERKLMNHFVVKIVFPLRSGKRRRLIHRIKARGLR
jgi:hypothetical protein